MNEPVATAHGTVYVTYHQFWLVDYAVSGPSNPFSAMRNGLVVVQPGVTVIATGIHTGYIRVTVNLHQGPPTVDTDGWDEVVEVSMESVTGQVRICGMMDHPLDAFPVLTPGGPGSYRLRGHAHGRDTAIDLVSEEPVEDYRIAVWSAGEAPDTVFKQTDQYSAMLRRATGGQ
jgi:hypothetical protein